jgi:hypothetical protein
LVLAGCEKASPPAAQPAAPANAPPGQPTAANPVATLTADPNPIPAEAPGTTTLSWNTGAGDGQVYLVSGDGKETLFAQNTKGAKIVDFFHPGDSGEFRLYAGTGHSQLLASVKVTRKP